MVLIGDRGQAMGLNEAWFRLIEGTGHEGGLGLPHSAAWEALSVVTPGACDVVERLVERARTDGTQGATIPWHLSRGAAALLVAATPLADGRHTLVTFEEDQSHAPLRDWSDRLVAHAQEMLGIGAWRWDLRTDLQTWSEQAYRLLGVEPSSEPPTREMFIRRVHPEDRERIRLSREAMTSNTTFVDEYRLLMDDGSVRYMRRVGEVRSDAFDQPYEVVGATLDVTDQKRALNAPYAILEEAPLPLIMIDEGGKVLLANRSTQDVFGWSPEELIGQDVAVLAADGALRHRAYMERFVATGEASTPEGLVVGRSREVMARRRDGSLFPADLAVSSFEAETRERRYLGILLDASARKDAEAEAMRSQRWEALGTLVAGVAHDFNNLLTGIMGGLSLLRDHPTEPRWLDIAERSANRATGLVQQLLQVARPTEGEAQWFEPTPVVERALQLAAETFYRRIELSLQVQPVRWGVLGDRSQIDQIVLNLLVNARDAVLDRALQTADSDYVPRIEVSVGEGALDGGPAVSIRVADNGTGMSPEVRRQAFDPFFTTKPEGTGTGLGLSMVQSLGGRHRGVLSLETAPMQGCAFEVLLPLVPDPGSMPREAQPVLERSRAIARLALVVDDEAMVGEVVRAYLEDFGYRVRLVGGGRRRSNACGRVCTSTSYCWTRTCLRPTGGKSCGRSARWPRRRLLWS